MSGEHASAETRVGPNSPEIVEFATRIYNAARGGDIPTFQQALPAGLPPNMTNDKGDSLLMLASYHGHYSLSKLLLEHGADPNVLNDRGQSPLAGAVFKKEQAVVDLLLEWNANPDIGTPSAADAVGMFRMEGDWEDKFNAAREKLKQKEGLEEVSKKNPGPGGTKAASQMI